MHHPARWLAYGSPASRASGSLGTNHSKHDPRANQLRPLVHSHQRRVPDTTDERDVRQEMEINNIPTLPVRIAKRAPYTRIFRDGVLLSELHLTHRDARNAGKTASVSDKAMKQVTGAIENARDYAQTVIATLTKGASGMSGKYGFSGGVFDLPKTTPAPKPRPKVRWRLIKRGCQGRCRSWLRQQGANDAPWLWPQTQRAAGQSFDTWPEARGG